MIDIRKLKELVRLMVANDLTEIDLRDTEEQVTVRRPSLLETPVAASQVMAAAQAPVAPVNGAATEATRVATPETVTDDPGLHRIESPMVGTFYATADPESPPFVKVGDFVGPESVVCLVEAMKIFNEIKAEAAGTIEKILVTSGDAVEFGDPLFLLRQE